MNSKLSKAILDNTTSIRNTLPIFQASINAIEGVQSRQQYHTMMEWLSPTDFPAQQHDIIVRRQEGTGRWFLDSLEFKKWLQGSDKTLFCPGIPGAGKTMIAAIAIDHLRKTTQYNEVGVAFLYCHYKAQVDHNASNLLSALLKQLVESRPDIAAPVTQMYKNHLEKRNRPSVDEIFQALLSVCSNYTKVHIVVDALDECADRDGSRSLLIDKLCAVQSRIDAQLLFTSRFIPDITRKVKSNLTIEIRASEDDVRRFLEGQIPRLPRCIQRDKELKSVIQDKITEAVDGM
jgi:Cdc6-like AAA superfamily ATPase